MDLGCGHGLLAFVIALSSSARRVLAIDHDKERISLGSAAIQGLPNIRIEIGSLVHPPQGEELYSGISLIDVMHYFDPKTQEEVLNSTFSLLKQGGVLLVREVDPDGGVISHWNRFYEKIATLIGFTESKGKTLHFRSRQEWEDLIQKTGFSARSEVCSSWLFADVLFICERSN